MDDIPLKSKIILGPVQKYYLYNRFPWKFITHIILVTLTTLQVILFIENTGPYTRSANDFFLKKFLNSDENYNEFEFDRFRNFYDIGQMRDHIV